MQTELSPRAGIGPVLRRARQERGVSLDAASRSTRIRPRYLAALEDDAGADAFPGPIYARFFLKEYARYLGVDDEPLVTALQERTAPPPPSLKPVVELQHPRRWAARLVRVMAVASLLGLLGYTIAASTPDRSTPSPDVRSRLTEVPAFASHTHASIEPPAPEIPIRMVVLVRAPTWIQAYVDGERVVKRLVYPRRLVLRALGEGPGQPRIDLEIADGSAVKLVVNGRVIPTEGESPFAAQFASWDGRTVRM